MKKNVRMILGVFTIALAVMFSACNNSNVETVTATTTNDTMAVTQDSVVVPIDSTVVIK